MGRPVEDTHRSGWGSRRSPAGPSRREVQQHPAPGQMLRHLHQGQGEKCTLGSRASRVQEWIFVPGVPGGGRSSGAAPERHRAGDRSRFRGWCRPSPAQGPSGRGRLGAAIRGRTGDRSPRWAAGAMLPLHGERRSASSGEAANTTSAAEAREPSRPGAGRPTPGRKS